MSDGTRVSRARRGPAARAAASIAGPIALLLVTVAVGVVAPAPASARTQQTPTPPRPLLLIGGTFVGQEHPDWGNAMDTNSIVGWLASRGGYQHNANNQQAVWVGQMCRDTGDQPYDFARCGTTMPAPPTNWVDVRDIFGTTHTWDGFVNLLRTTFNNSSTAGLSTMDKSVQYVMAQIDILRFATGSSQIDIVAHSQGGTIARAAIRRMEEANPSAPSPVRRLVTMGSPHYGASPLSWLFRFLNMFILGAEGDLDPTFMETCRDQRRLPMCPDMFLTGSSATVGAQSETPVTNPPPIRYVGPSGLIEFTHRGGFTFFSQLNDPGGVGPVTGDTQFINLYTRDNDGDSDGNGDPVEPAERLILEQIRLFPDRTNVENINYQDVCAFAGFPNFALDHSLEFRDPTSRVLIAHELGFGYTENNACL